MRTWKKVVSNCMFLYNLMILFHCFPKCTFLYVKKRKVAIKKKKKERKKKKKGQHVLVSIALMSSPSAHEIGQIYCAGGVAAW